MKIPNISALTVNARAAYLTTEDGEVQTMSHHKAAHILHDKPVLVCHAPYTCARLGVSALNAFDILELFAFVHPASFAVPTPAGIAKALGLSIPSVAEDYPFTLMEAMTALLSDLRRDPWKGRADPIKIAGVMGQNGKGWRWTPYIFSALGQTYDEKEIYVSKADLNVWKNLPEWAEEAPPPPASHYPVTGDEARERLARALGTTAEQRGAQVDYASAVTAMFRPVQDDEQPNAVLLEAGTGVGKTLGYLAPSSAWAEKNKGAVWISTYTKNLQRQIDQELDKIFPNPDVKNAKVAVRKGRENYLCLLNFEDIATGAALAKSANTAIAAGIMARWAAATKDGDMAGGDFPGWLSGLLGVANTLALTDRRGECIYSACDHYHRCFIERSIRKSHHANIVVANHALVMIQTASSSAESDLPRHYIFDEGHHLFDAADSAYAGHLTALETLELRRWLRGNESPRKSRVRGLKRRAEDLVAGDESLQRVLQDILEQARCLTAEGWQTRLKDSAPQGAAEEFLHAVSQQVYARADGRDGPYSLETDTFPLSPELMEESKKLSSALEKLKKPMESFATALKEKLNEQADRLDADTRRRIDAMVIAISLRSRTITAWIQMLGTLIAEANKAASGENLFVDWMEINRIDGRAIDVGLYRHWINPMLPFAESLRPHAHGAAVTSATLRDRTEDESHNRAVARNISGLSYLSGDIHEEIFESPFDYAARTKVFVVNDVRKDDLAQVANAYRVLFEAAGGGALGLFTAIQRLRAVHETIAAPLEKNGLHLYAQHVDAIDNGTLVDIFRDDVNACLLGTDAVRDGVDVPGESLRLIVFDRVPWPRPTILHRARKDAFGGKIYDDRLARFKLKQAYGRLIRRASDRGVFVMLDSMLPSRLYGAFPDGVDIQKTGIADAAIQVKAFLKSD